MSILVHTLWWGVFVVVATAAQAVIPGVDVFTVGMLVLLQKRDYKSLAWLLPIFILMQEGMGTREFGAAIVWYTAVILLFAAGRWLFAVESFLFVFLLSACLGAAHYGVVWLLAPLQALPFNPQDAMNTSLLQALILPFAWWFLAGLCRRNAHDHDK